MKKKKKREIHSKINQLTQIFCQENSGMQTDQRMRAYAFTIVKMKLLLSVIFYLLL